ncbi:hypothetical protein EK21DRAFT_87216 [Setomelanomma holmii]|uniref:Uncharacterized protein n=1 Tax=Setomelanomma holmii TaxID=210430 RepID=A0A9P4HCV8_9PLEO|nr:hypothetical protein EK21DRAFT_87216 [Setomelanomma holmii]
MTLSLFWFEFSMSCSWGILATCERGKSLVALTQSTSTPVPKPPARASEFGLSIPDLESCASGAAHDDRALATILLWNLGRRSRTLYSSITFVFLRPIDLHCFQMVVSPEGLASAKRLILAYGCVDWPGSGFVCPRNTPSSQGAFAEWQEAFKNVDKMSSLQALQVWLWHRDSRKLHCTQRPWPTEGGNAIMEKRHQQLFDILSVAVIPNFTVNLTWFPQDVLFQREWPLKVNLQTENEMSRAKSELPYATELDVKDLYDI